MTSIDTTAQRRTKRRYAHELYPHAEEWQTRPLEVEVPYLYARAIGFDVRGTGWFAHIQPESNTRTMEMINAHQIALMADAMFQGLTGQEAWAWATERMTDDGGWIYERAIHYGVDPDLIKPYPCGPTPDHHDHLAAPDSKGWQTVTRVPGAEDDCEECTEPVPEAEATEFGPDECNGSGQCTVSKHVHGCYSDLGRCDEPAEHRATNVDFAVATAAATGVPMTETQVREYIARSQEPEAETTR